MKVLKEIVKLCEQCQDKRDQHNILLDAPLQAIDGVRPDLSPRRPDIVLKRPTVEKAAYNGAAFLVSRVMRSGPIVRSFG